MYKLTHNVYKLQKNRYSIIYSSFKNHLNVLNIQNFVYIEYSNPIMGRWEDEKAGDIQNMRISGCRVRGYTIKKDFSP